MATQNVTMRREYRHKEQDGTTRVIPRDWTGDLPDAIADAARENGCTLEDPRQKTLPRGQGAGVKLDGMLKPALLEIAKSRGLPVKADVTKEEINALLQAPESELSDDFDGRTDAELAELLKRRSLPLAPGSDRAAVLSALRAAATK